MRRAVARDSLLGFTRYTFPRYAVAPMHQLICEKLERVERGECKRLMIFTPPRHGKSELVSRRWPARYIGKFPTAQFISASYGDDLATDFGRDVRNIVASEEYRRLYPGTVLSHDSAAKGKWHTTAGGIYISTSVGKGVTGRGADVLNIDDPIKDRIEAESETVRKNIWDWYTSTAYTRLMPGGAIVLTMCMVGQTRVTMADGADKELRDIVPGDKIATYDNGSLGSTYIVDMIDKGDDFVYEITTQSGAKTRANARHPFLVSREGKLEWIRLQSLREGDQAILLNKTDRTTSSTAHLLESNANLTDARNQRSARVSARHTITRAGGPPALDHRLATQQIGDRHGYKLDTASAKQITEPCLKPKQACARFVKSPPPIMFGPIGVENSASTTTTQPGKCAGFSVTTATLPSATEKMKPHCDALLNTSDFILDAISSVVEVGRDRVFDVQVARTENFIADGFVSHNTRWHEDDLAGKLLEAAKGGADQWEVIDLPALANSSVDPLGRQIDAPLWPERYDADALAKIRAAIGTRDWSALYQQSPSPETGSYFLKDWLRPVPTLPPRESLRVFGASDYAVTSDGGDYTVHIVLGVDSDDRLYVLDLWRGQASSDQWVEAFCDLVVRWKPMGWAEETGQIRAGIGPWLDRRSRERRAFVAREAFPTRGDKSVRAQSIRGRAALNGLYLPAGAPWRADFEAELLSFPAGRHDDQVDALGLVGQLLDVMMPPGKPKPPEKPVDSWAKAFARSDYEDNDWKTA
jgi:predicted phage terminase large subunit-like protein